MVVGAYPRHRHSLSACMQAAQRARLRHASGLRHTAYGDKTAYALRPA
jgi:hypothetical protein